ncbi:hypothetical protein [Streptomyces sp. NPDC090083]|uniref:hypothetical protein n=1 Tax=Streptomyces sp. NPDC090083 TaxID=3365941 RepID=UPI0038261321
MSAGSDSRSSRSVARTGAVLLVLLAALIHVLDCAHGPTAAPTGRADTLFSASSLRCGPAPELPHRPATGQTAPEDGDGTHCWGLDGPTLQPSRDVTVAEPAVHGLPLAAHPGTRPQPTAAAALRRSAPVPGTPSSDQARARLGVWRT